MSVENENETLSPASAEQLREAVAAIQDATFDVLIKKPTRETSFFVTVEGDDGRPRQMRIRYRALPPKRFDELVAAHPPTAKAQRAGDQWDKDAFPPALIAAVCIAPRMSLDQARDLLESDNWSAGESNALFFNALNVCNAGLDVPFTSGD